MAGTTAPSSRPHVLAVPAGEPPLIGRAHELAVLEQVVADPASPGLLLTGPLGVGRTRLLREASRAGRAHDRRVVHVRGNAAEVPLGPLAHLLPPVAGAPDRLFLLQHALTALRGDGPPALVTVDDAHRLDELTRTVLETLASAGDATVVATERSERAPVERLRTLGDDVSPLSVGPLSDQDTELLLAGMLGGDVEARTAQRLCDLAGGIPLFLRELVRSGWDSGRLTTDGGPWRWDGPVEPPRRLSGFLLAGTDATERLVLERVAVSGPVDPARIGDPGDPDTVTGLQRRGLLELDEAGRVGVAPLLAAALGATGGARAGTAAPFPPASVVPRQADAGARHRDPDSRADLELIEDLRWQDRVEELGPLLADAGRRLRGPDGRARLSLTHALLARRRGEVALDTLDAADEGPAAAAVREATARLDGVALDRGGVSGAGAAPGPGGAPGGCWSALFLAARAGRLAAAGRPAEALDAAGRAGEALADDGAEQVETALARLLVVDAELSALRMAGRPDDLERAADEAHHRNLASPGWAGDAWLSWQHGRTALARGDLELAGRRLAEARAGTTQRDPLALSADCVGSLALVHVLRGDLAAAAELLDPVPDRVPGPAGAAMERARTWLRAAGVTGAAPVRPLLAVAREAAARGDLVTEAVLLHDVARLGRPAAVADRLRTLAERARAPLPRLFAAHAGAAAVQDARTGARLDRVSAELVTAGARLDAADVAAAAAAAHRRCGERRRSAASAARATELAAACGARTPALDRLVRPRLTTREREVAALAAEGASNAEMARALVLSVRTVETHLGHVYAKLGIGSRAELGGALPTSPPGAVPSAG
ncbi:LuxR C-terminal-related transcriptional regulator [Pseudonocardia nematodicida]|uniref:LuxR C-terminal-related transcriptional regulator n=1 Tax=Pseudonocardia nematodicida TaxID=1206997 RepID=A0ABV1KB50_9PSEU